eukprot:5596699-Pleurochrysis_carterae.AAC.5
MCAKLFRARAEHEHARGAPCVDSPLRAFAIASARAAARACARVERTARRTHGASAVRAHARPRTLLGVDLLSCARGFVFASQALRRRCSRPRRCAARSSPPRCACTLTRWRPRSEPLLRSTHAPCDLTWYDRATTMLRTCASMRSIDHRPMSPQRTQSQAYWFTNIIDSVSAMENGPSARARPFALDARACHTGGVLRRQPCAAVRTEAAARV